MDTSTCGENISPTTVKHVPEQRSRKLPQYLAATAATLGAFAGGTALGWTSPAGPLLPLDHQQLSWAGSLLCVGAIVGAAPTGLAAQTLGRRTATAYLAVPFLASWALLLFCQHPWAVYVARLMGGVALGGVCVAVPAYVAEIAEDSVRGALGALLQVMFNAGLLFVYAVGAAENYILLSVACLVVPVVFLGAVLTVPESPPFLLSCGRYEEAARALKRLRGRDFDPQWELTRLKDAADKAPGSGGSLRALMSSRAAVRATLFSVALVASQQLSGVCVILFFAQNIFDAAGTSLSAAGCTVTVGAVMLVTSFATTALVDRAGRRPLLLASSSIMAVSLGVLGLYFRFHESGTDLSSVSWLPLTAMLLYIIMYVLGLGPLPWTVMAELLPPEVKGVGGSIVSAVCWTLSFLVTKSFQNLVDLFGISYTFWIFAFFCVISTIFVAVALPETKGKSLQQIQDELSGKPTAHRNGGPFLRNGTV